MEKNNMYFDTRTARISRDLYRPSTKVGLFLKSLFSVALSGKSPIGNPAAYKRKFH